MIYNKSINKYYKPRTKKIKKNKTKSRKKKINKHLRKYSKKKRLKKRVIEKYGGASDYLKSPNTEGEEDNYLEAKDTGSEENIKYGWGVISGQIKLRINNNIITKIKNLRETGNTKTGNTKTYKILWVRHCKSCANDINNVSQYISSYNDFKKSLNQKVFREPLCLNKDSINQAINLGKFLKSKFEGKQLYFFSSYLVRTMETAKAITFGYDSDYTLGNEIKRLNYISEELKFYDKRIMSDERLRQGKTSQSVTTVSKSNKYADYINNNLNGYQINKESETDNITIENLKSKGIISSGDLNGDYNNFIQKYMIQGNGLLKQGEDNINIIVSHGGYIRRNIVEPYQMSLNKLIKHIKHPNNTESYLVTYTINGDQVEFDIEEQHGPGKNNDIGSGFFKDPEFKDTQFCDLTYNQHIIGKNQDNRE